MSLPVTPVGTEGLSGLPDAPGLDDYSRALGGGAVPLQAAVVATTSVAIVAFAFLYPISHALGMRAARWIRTARSA